MRKLKLFFACLLMSILSIGQVWGADVVFDLTTQTQITTQTQSQVVFTNGSATITINRGKNAQNQNATAVNNYMPGGSTNASHTRVYAFNQITLNIGSGSTISSVKVKVTSSSGAINYITNGTWNPTVSSNSNSGQTTTYVLSSNSQTVTITPSGTSRIEEITLVPYSGGSTTPTAPVDPEITFNDGKLVVGKTLDLSTLFTSNSEGTVTYSIKNGGTYATISSSNLTGVAPGTVTIQASQAAATGYNAKSAECTINVVRAISFDFEANSAHRTSSSNSYAAAGNTYTQNSSNDISCIYMDIVTSGTPLSGSANALGRIAGSSTNSPVLTLGPISIAGKKVTGVSYLTKGAGAMTQVCSYSLNNSDWTSIKTITPMPTQSTEESVGNLNITGTNLYLKIATTVSSSTNSNRDLQIDDILISYEDLKYTVSFDANGGTGTMSAIENVTYNASQVITANAFERTGYTFQGWATSSTGTKVYNNNGTIEHVTGDMTLYALWSANSFNIELNKNGGTSNGAASIHYDASDLNITSNASWVGHNLLGYFTATEGGSKVIDANGSLISNVANYTSNTGKWIKAEDCTLYAQWETVAKYTISYGELIGCTAASGNATEFEVGASSLTLNFNLSEERTWTNATISVTMGGSPMSTDDYDLADGELTIMPSAFSGNIVVSISAPVQTYTVLIGANNSTYGSAVFVVEEQELDEVTVAKSATTTIKATANTGYQFVNWTTDDNVTIANANNAQTTISAVSENAAILANFSALPTAHLTLKNLGEDHAESGDHAILTAFNLPTTAASCSKAFVGWDANPNCATTPTYAKGASFQFDDENDVTLYAVYADGGSTNEQVSTTMTSLVSANNYSVSENNNVTCYTSLELDDNITLSTTGSANCGSFWGAQTQDWRLYQKQSGNAIVTAANGCTLTSVKFTFNNSYDGVLLDGDNAVTSGTAVNASGSSATYTVTDTEENTQNKGQIRITAIEVNYSKPGEYSNYSTTCVEAPTATPASNPLEVSAAGVNDATLGVTYDNVNLAGVSVALCSDNQGAAFTGDWLTATIAGEDKHIEYTVQANTSYNDARTAYIQLTAPETSDAASPAVVYIEVTQAKKPAVFANLAELAAADVAANTNVTVTLTNEVIKEIYIYNNNRRGLVFNVQKDNEDVKIYFNADVPAAWVAGGKVSGTLTDCPWKIYSGAWQLAPSTGFVWNENLTYTAPPAIELIEIRGNSSKKTYIDGQVFNPAGLSVIAIYDDNITEEDVTEFATWTYNPAKLSESDTEVTVTATYNEKSDDETVTGLTVNPIPNKTNDEFITAGGTRCYLEGIVGTIENTTYGNFYLADESGTIYVYGCLTPSGESKKFDKLGVEEGDRIKVIAEAYTNHVTKGHEAVNVVFVSKVSPVQITIADKNLEVGHSWTIEATTDPAAAVDHISYSIKNDGSDAYVSLATNVITAVAEGDATIIATIPDGDGYLANSIEFNVHVTPAIVRTGIYAKVTSNAELTDGEYLIVYETGNLAFDGSLQTLDASSNNFAVTIESNKIIATAEIDAKSFTINMTDGTIKSAGGKFIGRTAISNGMNESSEEQYTNTLSIDNGGNAVIVGSAGAYMRYNANSDQERFRYFKSDSYTGQKAIQLYKKATYTRTVSGNYGTICLPNGGILTNGALYEVAYYDNASNKIFFDEVLNGEMKAGMPYIFLPNEGVTELKVVYTDSKNKTQAASADEANGLVGNLGSTVTLSIGDYFLYKNQYYVVSASESRIISVPQYYAYINMSYVPDYPTAPAPGRRRVSMNVNGEQVATGVESIQPSEVSIQKVLINGELFILRGEKMYDATGRLVK